MKSELLGALRELPAVQSATTYQRAWLGSDGVAGLALTALLIPTAMGYAQASGLPAVTGLYSTVLAMLVYVLFGPTRVLVVGPDSALVPLVAVAVLPVSHGDPARAVVAASTLALVAGAACVLAGVCRLGFVTDLISNPVRTGYLNGIALTVIAGQLATLMGFSAGGYSFVAQLAGVVQGIARGEVLIPAVLIGGSCLVLVLALRWRLPKVPAVLIAIVLSGALVALLDLDNVVSVVGPVPSGLPSPQVPDAGVRELTSLAPAALAIALVAFADTSVLTRTYAARDHRPPAPNREVFALGLENIAASLFQGFPVSSSATRTPVALSSGARTRLAGLVSALTIVLVLRVTPGLLSTLPKPALAAIVIAAAIGLLDTGELRFLWSARRSEFTLSVATLLGILAFGVLPGIGLAVALSVLNFLRRAWWPHDAVLGRADGVHGYHDLTRYPHARQIPGLLIYRWDAPLFFANADIFRSRIDSLVRESPARIRWFVVSADPITDVDTTAADMLSELIEGLNRRRIRLVFAGMKDPVKDRLRSYGLFDAIGKANFHPTIGEAVARYLHHYRVSWVDWEDRPARPRPAARRRALVQPEAAGQAIGRTTSTPMQRTSTTDAVPTIAVRTARTLKRWLSAARKSTNDSSTVSRT